MIGFFTSPRFAFGSGAIEQLSALDAGRPVVVISPALRGSARTRRIVEELAKREVSVTEITAPLGPPSLAAVDRLAQELTNHGPDWIVAVGGGSTIDLAKGAWVRFERPDLPLAGLSPLVELGLRKRSRFVAIPSTSGAGTESSPSLLWWDASGAPLRATSRELVADWVLLDPELPRTVPKPARADASAIALGHSLESLASSWTNPVSDALAREALAQLVRSLPKLVRDPEDFDAVSEVHHAAAMAGLAAGNSQDGAAAALAEAAAPSLGLSYGRCLAILLPGMTEFNYPSARDLYQSLSTVPGVGPVAHRSDLARKLRSILEPLGIPRGLQDAGVDGTTLREAKAVIIARASRSSFALSNPRVPSAGEWSALLDAAATGGPVDF